MVNRRTLGTAKTTFCSTSIVVASVAILWLAATGYAQKAVSSPCSNNNADCQHMCSESKDIYDVLQYKCACNKGYLLAEDKHNCVLIDEILLYSQEHSIKSKVLNNFSGKYNESIRTVVTSSMRYVRFDFDAHDNYIYYTEVPEASVIYKIHINGNKGEVTVLSRFERERVVDLSVDWVTKNLYYIDINKGTLNVLSTRNVTNKRVLLQNDYIRRLVVHPNKGYIFFSENGVNRVNMDGSNLISFKYTGLYWSIELAVDFAADRLYWCEPNQNLIYHSNLDLTDVISVKSRWINSPWLIATHRDWMYIINNSGSNSIIKLHKLTGVITNFKVQDDNLSKLYNHVNHWDNNDSKVYNLKTYSEYKRRIYNMHPCSMAANYGGCQKLCFAVPSNKSITSSLQALCSCLVGEKVDSDGKTCVIESKAAIDSNAVIDSNVVVDSKAVVDSNAVIESVSGGPSSNIPHRHVTAVCYVLVFLSLCTI